MFKSILHTSFLVIFCVVAYAEVDGTASEKTPEKIKLADESRKLQAAHESWLQNDAKYRELCKRKEDPPDKSEIREFAAYVARLKRRVFEDCEIFLELGGDPNQVGIVYTAFKDERRANNKDVDLSSLKRELTREEIIAIEEKRLEELGSAFDRDISKYKGKGSGRVAPSQSNGNWAKSTGNSPDSNNTESHGEPTGGSGKKNGSKSEPMKGKGASGGAAGEETQAKGPNSEIEYEPGAGPGLEKGKIPDFKNEEIGDGSDDDIVARQLREAAESETDPELREQLWNEYKKYKKSAR